MSLMQIKFLYLQIHSPANKSWVLQSLPDYPGPRSVPWRVNTDVLRLAVDVFLKESDPRMLAALSLPLHPDNIPPPQLVESIKVAGITCF